jgi:hypothetical protein
MADSYFIKRGEKSKGPFSLSQLQEFLKGNQVKSADMISVSAEGPWVRFASVFKEVKQGVAPPLPDPLSEAYTEKGQEDEEEFAEEDHDEEEEFAEEELHSRESFSDRAKQAANKGKKGFRQFSEKSAEFAAQDIEASDPLFSVAVKLLGGNAAYSYHDDDYPALSACMRILATGSRIYFIGHMFLLFASGMAGVLGERSGIEAWAALSGTPLLSLVEDGKLQLSPWFLVMPLIVDMFLLVVVFAICEVVRLLCRLEKNTRS